MELNDEKLLQIAKDLYKLYTEEKESLPYSLNLVYELRDYENAHSRILRGLLQYNRKGCFPILQSFIERVKEIADCNVDIRIKKPELTNEEHNIDLLIKEKKSYAIIVENKIWNARDQNKQIERYVDYVKDLGIPKRKIFVIYLTQDGQKEISDNSLTPMVQKILGCTNRSKRRFIPMNYKYDIMPWLEELLRNKYIQDEPLLQSAVIQYADYLKILFDARKEDIEIEKKLEEKLMNDLNIKSIQELLQTRNEVDKLQEIVTNTTDNKIEELCKKKIYNVLKRRGYEIKKIVFQYDSFDLEIQVPKWEKCWWSIENDENESNKLFFGIWKDPQKTIAKKYIKKLEYVFDNVQDEGYIGWEWFGEYELNDEFWLNIETHSTKFVNAIVRDLERIRENTEELNL